MVAVPLINPTIVECDKKSTNIPNLKKTNYESFSNDISYLATIVFRFSDTDFPLVKPTVT